MEYRQLGRTGISVSAICLGTMTWGKQNTEAEGHQQMDYALDRGINFFDTAEMYAVPPSAETFGKTEEIIGTWFRNRGTRDKVVLATKVVGPGAHFSYIRDGKTRLDRENIVPALEDSLRRLQTDYVDLYQLHWPDRWTNMFGRLGYTHDPDAPITPPEETLDVLAELVRAGKVRHVGLSNDTPWGMMRFLHLAETRDQPRMVSIQNPYSLLNRTFEVGLAECAIREDCGLLAYSPLAGGALSGKYLGGARPPGARMTLFEHFSRYNKPLGIEATGRYVALAREHGLDPAQMALAFVTSRPFVTANIIGATTMEQLRANIASVDTPLSEAVLAGIEAIHGEIPNPCP
ncbi:MAG: NADP(H)-dependent aldo-keto reductase [Alphaproteobacteria bacterium]|jgi:aryl-alcohol dehydrogenase-like predicted oxidoreductase|nr:NADP(H)-dependent aldo-keto reductase [Alphaproteobacteria bacterium]